MAASASVHPWRPRFAQGVTGALCLEALLFGEPIPAYVALALVAIAAVAPALSPVDALFRLIVPVPRGREPAAPARFSQWMAVAALAVATGLLIAGPEAAGWILVGLVAGVALLEAIGGICAGCEIHRRLRARRGGPSTMP